ncbi:MAG: hypothetical protein ACK57B_05095 [Betaproteobacteria bacterium]|jgi:hypothetical protein
MSIPYTTGKSARRHPRKLSMGLSVSFLCVLLVACGGGDDVTAAPDVGSAPPIAADTSPPRTAALPPGHLALGVPLSRLQFIFAPFGSPHEALPAGVPPGFDWRERSKRDNGYAVPAGFTAFTGWAQAFWIDGAPVGTQRLEIRQNQTLICTWNSGRRQWQRVQRGDIEGAAFRADFAGNENVPAEVLQVMPGQARIGFGAGRAYHFWPHQGRIVLGSQPLCGVLALFEARAVTPDGRSLPAGAASTLLAGGGADFWLNTAAPWDNYRTNIGVGVGVLRRVGPSWEWHGMGTADADSLEQLARDGFVERSSP